ncbi:FAD-dependent oxidoreductase [Kiloniella sp.]|uniref:FAD-dependent oxidoreductase n=1 Tax=Kiloniella sp. TaxID=1938587 RepID=UPI003B01AF94
MTVRQTRVLVIGGGIMGVATLYNLAANGWTDVMLCEKAELTSGSTWHAAGQITHAVGSRTMGWINNYSINLYKKLEKETGLSISWHECGGLRVANTDLEVDWLKSILNVGELLDLPMELVGPEKIKKLNPFYNTKGIKAALHTKADGHVDPSGATQVCAAAARKLGATIDRFNRVIGVVQREGGDWLVHTEKYDVIAEHVVIAAGSYANQVGKWFGLTVPSCSVLHHYLVTETVPEFAERSEEIPIMRDNSMGGYIRQEQKSALIGIYENKNSTEVWTDGAPWDSVNELFEADYDGIGDYLERAMDRIPIVSELGIKRVVRGAITHTPDGGMLVGPAPGHDNVWMACGSSIGLAWGGGATKCLADLMVHGETEISMRAMDPRRFGNWIDEDYIVKKTKEDFEIRHNTPVPGMQRPLCRPTNRSPIHDRLASKGAVFGDISGWERPRWFADRENVEDVNGWRRQTWFDQVGKEHTAVREAAGIIDLTAFSQFIVSGRDAAELLNRLSANKVPTGIGRVSLAHMLTEKGNFETEMTITRLPGDRFLLGSAIAGEIKDKEWLERHIKPDQKVTVENLTGSWGMLALSGPKSRDILNHGVDIDLSNAKFKWLSAQEIKVFGVECIALRVSFTGELGWEFHAPHENIAAIYDGLMETGHDYGLKDIGSHAFNSLRMEKAYRASAELSPEIGMYEADMDRFFIPDNRRFIGREATLERSEKGITSKLVYLAVDVADADCIGGEAIFHNGSVVGQTTSGGYGYSMGAGLAFGFVKPDLATSGVNFEIQILGKKHKARVLADPIYDPSSARLRS